MFGMAAIATQSFVYADADLKFQWRFNEGVGTVASDSSGNTPSYDGTLYNGATWVPGGGVALDGINDYARTDSPIPGSMGVPDQAYTLTASVRVAEGETQGNIIHISNGSDGIGWCISMLHLNDGKFRAIGWESGFPIIATAPEAAVPGEWYSIANTWSPETNSLDLYVNGVLVASSTMTDFDAANQDVYVFAGFGTGGFCNNDQGFFEGDVKDVRIYSRAITEEEVVENSNEVVLGAPYVVSTTPVYNANGVTTTDDLSMTFSSNVTTATGTINIYRASDDSLFESILVTSSAITGSGTDTITINPDSIFAASTTYYVQVSSTAFVNASGTPYAGISDTTTWTFTTAVDSIMPTLLSFSPVDNATSVGTQSHLVLTFDEPVTVTTGTINLYNGIDNALLNRISVTSSEVTGTGTDTITINMDRFLYRQTAYYVQFETGVFQDMAGNDLPGISNTTTWNFTTVNAGSSSKILFSPTSSTLLEDGGIQQFAVNLPEPIIVMGEGSEVLSLYLVIDDTNEATINTTTLTWTTSTWNETRYVTTTAINDDVIEDDTANLYWEVDSDSAYYQGSSGSITLTLTDDDLDPPSLLTYASPNTYTVNTPIAILTPAVTGVVTTYSVLPTLPAGLILDPATGGISGTPLVSVPQDTYTVTASNGGGETTFAITITVENIPEEPEEGDVSTGGGARVIVPPRIAKDSILKTSSKDSDGVYMSGAFTINNGDAVTQTREVTLTFTDIEHVAQVALSEDPSFVGISYQPFATTLPFTLSEDSSTKTLYAKLRSPNGSTITFKDSIALTPTNIPIDVTQSLQCSSDVYLTNAVGPNRQNNPQDVRLLEEFLNTYENTNLEVNGIYDADDIDAVISWQEKYAEDILMPWGISNGTGYVFTTSLAKIKQIHEANCTIASSASQGQAAQTATIPTACLMTTQTLSIGMSNTLVSIAQRLLKNLGYFPADVEATGYFGSITQAATIDFQAANSIQQLGIIGPLTRARLNEIGC